ncbi:MAG: hypothetical protein IJ157_13495 [Clostridia bacterium]|nr:hypothetical protein [Clostridia bacterium]
MALLTMEMFSKSLMVVTQVSILLPSVSIQDDPKSFYSSRRRYKVLWLLHGACSNNNDWIKYTNITQYAENRDLIVVMPNVLNSDYSNYSSFADGFNVWDYLTEELMPMVYNWLPASDRREDNFIAGMSMGGNGTLMFTLGHPELFGGAAILSSTAREIEYLRPLAGLSSAQFREAAKDPVRCPGPNGTGMRLKEINQVAKYPSVQDFLDSYENAWDRLPEAAAKGNLPRMYIACGTKDPNVYPRYLRFREYIKQLGVDAVFQEFEGYKHEYPMWDIAIQKALDFFGIEELPFSKH